MGLFFRNSETSGESLLSKREQSCNELNCKIIDNSSQEQLLFIVRDNLDDYSEEALQLKSSAMDISNLEVEELRALARRVLKITHDVSISH